MQNYSIILNGCIDQFKQNNQIAISDSSLFELFSVSQITKSFDLSFEDIDSSIVDGSNDGGIDSIIILINDITQESLEAVTELDFSNKTVLTILITQSKTEKSFKESTLDKIITSLPELFNLELSEDALLVRFNPTLVDKAMIAREAWKRCMVAGGSVNVRLAYCCKAESIVVNDAYLSKVDQLLNLLQNQFIGGHIDFNNVSCQELIKLYQTQPNQRLSITFKESPLSTNYDSGIGYVGTVKLADYKSFLSDSDGGVRDDLFESNIRHFQGAVDVNKGIKDTVEYINKNDFWWLNNGITIIASNPTQVGKTLSLDNVQIVNGLQTSYSIYNHHNGEMSDIRSVLVKVIITEDKETIDKIIASTNNQNPVSPALLRATDDVQRNLELFFFNAGYFYDRRKNYYKNMGKPASKIFSIQAAGQAIEAIMFNNPHSARAKPTSLIKEDTTYNRIFNASRNFNLYLHCCIIARRTNEYCSGLENVEMKSRISNFKLHLARIATSVIMKSSNVSFTNLEQPQSIDYPTEVFFLAVEILNMSIKTFQEANPEANLINMAKSKGLSDELNTTLSMFYKEDQ